MDLTSCCIARSRLVVVVIALSLSSRRAVIGAYRAVRAAVRSITSSRRCVQRCAGVTSVKRPRQLRRHATAAAMRACRERVGVLHDHAPMCCAIARR
jgi:hypothetical protein